MKARALLLSKSLSIMEGALLSISFQTTGRILLFEIPLIIQIRQCYIPCIADYYLLFICHAVFCIYLNFEWYEKK